MFLFCLMFHQTLLDLEYGRFQGEVFGGREGFYSFLSVESLDHHISSKLDSCIFSEVGSGLV